MASVPNDTSDAAYARAAQAAEINIHAVRNFNRGLRSVYFALAALAWLLGPIPLMIATALTLVTLWRREFASHSRGVLLKEETMKLLRRSSALLATPAFADAPVVEQVDRHAKPAPPGPSPSPCRTPTPAGTTTPTAGKCWTADGTRLGVRDLAAPPRHRTTLHPVAVRRDDPRGHQDPPDTRPLSGRWLVSRNHDPRNPVKRGSPRHASAPPTSPISPTRAGQRLPVGRRGNT